MTDPSSYVHLLTDNGSYRPEATLSLRRLAGELSIAAGIEVNPVSLLHSAKIAPEKIGGKPADILEPFVLARRRSHGDNRFKVVPLFFGPSAAIAEYIPQRVEALKEEHDWPELEIVVAPPLVDASDAEDTRIASILTDLALAKAKESGLERPAVAVCDHGAPRPAVTGVRNHLASQVARLGGDRFSTVAPCSMERRDGGEYAFNEPLLEDLLGSSGFEGSVVVSMLFFQPGRHAGPGGDVATICADAEAATPGLTTHMTDLVGSDPAIIPLLLERLRSPVPPCP